MIKKITCVLKNMRYMYFLKQFHDIYNTRKHFKYPVPVNVN